MRPVQTKQSLYRSSHYFSGLENKSRSAHAPNRQQRITFSRKSYFERFHHRADSDQMIMETSQILDTPDWENLYINEPLTSIRQFISLQPGGNIDVTYMRDVANFVELYWDEMQALPVLLETTNRWDDPHCQAMISSITRLTAFIGGSNDMKLALSALSTSPNDCTRLLLKFLTLLDNHTIIKFWKTEALDVIKRREVDHPLQLQDYKASSISRYYQRQCERSETVISSLWGLLQRAAKKPLLHKENILSSSKVADFCIRAGCPSVTRNPVKNVQRLRAHLATRSSAIREAELRREIEELRSENQRQQRIIANLTFRHLLENLPPTSSKKMTSTARWTEFFKNAMESSKSRSENASQKHPLDALLSKYRNASQIERIGVGLYSTFSTNIHSFNSQYTVIESQWNTLECDIMKALVPTPSNVTADGIDWQKERERYRAM
jgi:hypothetical protein